MNCLEAKRKMGAYCEDLLSESEYQDVSFHLSSCGSCMSYASVTGSLSHQIKELGRVTVPADLLAVILSKVQRRGGESEEVRSGDG